MGPVPMWELVGSDEAGLGFLDVVVPGGIQVEVVKAEEVGGIVDVDATGGVKVQEWDVLFLAHLLLMLHVLGDLLHVGDHVDVVLTPLLWDLSCLFRIQGLVLQNRNREGAEEEDLSLWSCLTELVDANLDHAVLFLQFHATGHIVGAGPENVDVVLLAGSDAPVDLQRQVAVVARLDGEAGSTDAVGSDGGTEFLGPVGLGHARSRDFTERTAEDSYLLSVVG